MFSSGADEVVGTNDPSATRAALEPLSRAAGLYRWLRSRPRLLLTLCDLVRATFYARSNEQFQEAITELDTLAPAFPGLEPHALLAKVELLLFTGQLDAARTEANRLLKTARETGNRWAEGKALTFLEQAGGG